MKRRANLHSNPNGFDVDGFSKPLGETLAAFSVFMRLLRKLCMGRIGERLKIHFFCAAAYDAVIRKAFDLALCFCGAIEFEV